jgi:acyl-coenzyme A thioesterase PaaI-like protein
MSAKKLARKARWLRWAMNLYPPYLGAGIRVRQISADFRQVQVKMVLSWYNRNYVGTHFGGSLYSMTDPFFMLMIVENLGGDFIVWDKAARIDFIAPGTGPVYANFSIDEQLLEDIRRHSADGDKYHPELQVEVRDGSGSLVARVHKTLYVRLKPRVRQAA